MAGRIALDLKAFKHLKSDDKSTTLQHADGHVLTIAHNVLSPENQKQLKALANIPKDAETDADKAEAKSPYGSVKATDTEDKRLGSVKKPHMYEGGIPPEHNQLKSLQEDKKKYIAKHPNSQAAPPTPPPPKEKPAVDTSAYDTPDTDTEQDMYHAKGGIVGRKMYAEGDFVDTDIDNLKQGVDKTAEEMNKKDLINKYNIEVAQKNAMTSSGNTADTSQMIGANDELPSNIDTDAAAKAKVAQNQQKEDEAKQKAAQQNKNYSDSVLTNQALKDMGKPTTQPIPGVTPADQAAGSVQQTVPQGTPTTEMPPAAQPSASGDGIPTLEGIAHTMQSQGNLAIQGQEKVNKAQGDAERLAQEEKLNADAAATNHFINVNKDLDQERLNHVLDAQNGYIDPDKYWNGYDTAKGHVGGHSKIATGIGMILAGFNPTNNPNAAVNFLKFQMEQSLEAQKQNLNSTHNLLRANLQQFGNVRNAMDMTRLQLGDQLQAKLGAAAAQAKSAGAAPAAAAARVALAQSLLPISNTLYARHALSTLSGNPQVQAAGLRQMAVSNPEVYKEMMPKFVPGQGFADRDVSGADQDTLADHKLFETTAADLQQFVDKNGGTLGAMSPANRAIAAQKATVLQSLFRKGTLNTVYREGEQPLLDKVVKGQPLSFASYFLGTEEPKLQEARNANKRAYDSKRTSLGGDLSRAVQQEGAAAAQQQSNKFVSNGNHAAALAWANAHPKDPRAAKILSIQGQ